MSISIEDLSNKSGFTTAAKGQVSFLPEPEPAPREFTVISVDDHVVEPPHAFEGRLPRKLQDRAPRCDRQASPIQRRHCQDPEVAPATAPILARPTRWSSQKMVGWP